MRIPQSKRHKSVNHNAFIKESEIFLGDRPKGGGVPTTRNRLFLGHRTTHSAKNSFLKMQ